MYFKLIYQNRNSKQGLYKDNARPGFGQYIYLYFLFTIGKYSKLVRTRAGDNLPNFTKKLLTKKRINRQIPDFNIIFLIKNISVP